jgi:hypothetical protein
MKPSERKSMQENFQAITDAFEKDILDNLTDE